MKTHPAMRDFLDNMQAVGTITGAARAMGKNRATPTRWLAESRAAAKTIREDERARSPYWLEHPLGSGNFAFLHEHEQQVTREMVQDILKGVLIRARDGVTMPSMFQGRRVPAIDYDLIELGFSEAEAIKRVNGEVVFEEIWTPPSNELALATLAAYNKRFAKRMSVEHQHQHAGGVQIAHSIGSMSRKQLAQSQPLPMLEIVEPVAAEVVDMSMVEDPPGGDEPEPQEEAAQPPSHISHAQSPLRAELERRAREKGIPL